eukprot:scaffold17047_cov104-Isochrysis_galbana.AAC.3
MSYCDGAGSSGAKPAAVLSRRADEGAEARATWRPEGKTAQLCTPQRRQPCQPRIAVTFIASASKQRVPLHIHMKSYLK